MSYMYNLNFLLVTFKVFKSRKKDKINCSNLIQYIQNTLISKLNMYENYEIISHSFFHTKSSRSRSHFLLEHMAVDTNQLANVQWSYG